MKHLILTLVPVLVAPLSCLDQQFCTLAGCSNSLAIEAEFAAEAQSIVVELQSSSISGAFRCIRSGDSTFSLDAAAGTGAFSPPATFDVSCIGGRQPLFIIDSRNIVEMPEAVTVFVTADDDETRSQTFSPVAYTTSRPNGEQCEPECLSAKLAMP